MIQRPDTIGAFEYAVTCGLRAAQLSRGCTPRVPDSAGRKTAITAQLEVSSLRVVGVMDHSAETVSAAHGRTAPSDSRARRITPDVGISDQAAEALSPVGDLFRV
jgi:hypothetical protein